MRQRAALFRARAQVRQAHAKDRRLHFVETAVHSDFGVAVPIALSAIAQPCDSRGEGRVAGDDRAGITHGPQVLRRVETERACGAERADRLTRARRHVSLAAILDERDTLSAGERGQRFHVCRLTVEVHRH